MDNQTVIQKCKDMIQQSEAKRLPRLIELNAPQVMIDTSRDIATNGPKINDKDGVGGLTFTDLQRKKGRGGVPFYQFTTPQGLINFFPNGRYGMFISKNKSKK